MKTFQEAYDTLIAEADFLYEKNGNYISKQKDINKLIALNKDIIEMPIDNCTPAQKEALLRILFRISRKTIPSANISANSKDTATLNEQLVSISNKYDQIGGANETHQINTAMGFLETMILAKEADAKKLLSLIKILKVVSGNDEIRDKILEKANNIEHTVTNESLKQELKAEYQRIHTEKNTTNKRIPNTGPKIKAPLQYRQYTPKTAERLSDSNYWLDAVEVSQYLRLITKDNNKFISSSEDGVHAGVGKSFENGQPISINLNNMVAHQNKFGPDRLSLKETLDLQPAKVVLLPVNTGGHWTLVSIEKNQDNKYMFNIYDSHTSNEAVSTKGIVKNLCDEMGIAAKDQEIKFQKSLQQDNGSDCGAFTGMHAKLLIDSDKTNNLKLKDLNASVKIHGSEFRQHMIDAVNDETGTIKDQPLDLDAIVRNKQFIKPLQNIDNKPQQSQIKSTTKVESKQEDTKKDELKQEESKEARKDDAKKEDKKEDKKEQSKNFGSSMKNINQSYDQQKQVIHGQDHKVPQMLNMQGLAKDITSESINCNMEANPNFDFAKYMEERVKALSGNMINGQAITVENNQNASSCCFKIGAEKALDLREVTYKDKDNKDQSSIQMIVYPETKGATKFAAQEACGLARENGNFKHTIGGVTANNREDAVDLFIEEIKVGIRPELDKAGAAMLQGDPKYMRACQLRDELYNEKDGSRKIQDPAAIKNLIDKFAKDVESGNYKGLNEDNNLKVEQKKPSSNKL